MAVNKVQYGNTTLIDLSTDTVASAADIVAGKVGHLRDGSVVTGTASGGGGASNVVTGTFTGTTTGAAMDVNLNYTGTGYPVAVLIYPTGGFDGNTTFKNLIQQYAIFYYLSIKRSMSRVPRYTGQSLYDDANSAVRYKSSASSASSFSSSSLDTAIICNNANAGKSNASACAVMKSATKMSVFIASTYYGFAANIEYTYQIIYSS